jgi:hypothetical protein
MLSKLVKLCSGAMPTRPGRGRQTSSSSPSLRNLHLSPTGASPLASRQSPGGAMGGGGSRAVKQLALSGLPMDNSGAGSSNKPGSPLAVPLETPHLLMPSAAIVAAPTSAVIAAASAAQTTVLPPSGAPTQLLLMSSTEVEFRKPLLPPPAAAAALRQQQAAAFREQVGQYLPKFTSRRGRQNRSRAKNLVVGRQLLQQQPRQLLPLLPEQKQQLVLQVPSSGIQEFFPHHQITILNTTTATPMAIFTSTTTSSGGGFHIEEGQQQQQEFTLIPAPQMSSSVSSSSALSPPQISIPSPALSPVRPNTPSPTPSLSSLMDLSFSDSIHQSAAMAAAAGGLTTPTKGVSLTFLSDILTEDTNSLLHTPPRPSTPTSSRVPSRYLTDTTGDLSLSSWALSFESPLKSSSSQGGLIGSSSVSLLHSEDSQTSIISTSSEVNCDSVLTKLKNTGIIPNFPAVFRILIHFMRIRWKSFCRVRVLVDSTLDSSFCSICTGSRQVDAESFGSGSTV